MMETVEDGADVWSPEARQAVNDRDHSCLLKDEKSGQTVHENISKEEATIDRSPSDGLTKFPKNRLCLICRNTYLMLGWIDLYGTIKIYLQSLGSREGKERHAQVLNSRIIFPM